MSRRKLTASDYGTLSSLTKSPDKVINPDTGEWREEALEDIQRMSNKLCGVYRGRSADGHIRECTPHDEDPKDPEFLDSISTDPQAIAAQSLHRPHLPKQIRIAQTGGVSAEEKLTRKQKRWLAELQGDDPEARAKAEAEVRAWMLEKHQAEQEDIDASLAEMGYAEDSVPRARSVYPDPDDEFEYGIFPLEDDDDPELDYLSIDLNDPIDLED